MTQEEKYLLLQDLCARLPYGTKVRAFIGEKSENDEIFACIHIFNFYSYNCKPYLRPMSSMTEDEKKELLQIINDETNDVIEQIKNDNCGVMEGKYHFNSLKQFDWLNAHYFDYRGLIPQGLALKAPNDMYNIK